MADADPNRRQKPVCLIIEDSRTQALHISNLVKAEGWVPIVCFDSRQHDVLSKAQAPDAILMDLYLERGESLSSVSDLHDKWPNSPITVMTAGDGVRDPNYSLRRARKAGADFVLRKPFGAEVLEDILTDSVQLKRQGRRRIHILVVDDSSTVRMAAGRIMADLPCRTSVVASMEEVLERLTFDTVDVVVTDIFMPGMGGIKGIERIREGWPELGVVAMSGGLKDAMTSEAVLDAAERIGADATLPKPFNAAQIWEAAVAAATLKGVVDRLVA